MFSVIFGASASAQAATSETAPVIFVSDGDTFGVILNHHVRRIRVIGIDTPETKDPRKPVQCFGQQASRAAKQLLSRQTVTLSRDPATNEHDKYGRLLRSVTLPDGRDFGMVMLSGGFAHIYIYFGQAFAHEADYQAAQADAQAAGRGLWHPGRCGH